MKIPTILKGDDSGAITITLPDGRDFTGATLVLAYGGVTRSFTDLVPGATLSFGFTHDETAGFKLGCKPVLMRLIGPSGAVETVENAAMKIKVTDCLGEVNAGGSFAISPRDLSTSVPVTDLGDLSTTAKIGDLYDKVNEIVRVLAQRSLLVLTLCLGLAAGADVQTARLEDLDRSSVVVTNVTGSSGVDTNAVRDIALWPATNYTDRATGEVIRSVGALADTKRDKTDYKTDMFNTFTGEGVSLYQNLTCLVYYATESPAVEKWICILRSGGNDIASIALADVGDEIDFYQVSIVAHRDTLALTSQLQPPPVTSVNSQTGAVTLSASDVGAYPNASGQTLAAQVATIGGHLNAEDARFVSTNYNSATHMPEAYVEVKLPDGTWSVVWREMTRWNWLTETYLPTAYASKADLDEKADRAWGYYDSHSGNFAPEGYTWISSPKLALAGGLAWQRTVTTEGEIWVIESNGLVTETGGVTNGFFRISDDEGNTQFEIVKGNKRTIGADSSGMHILPGFAPTRMMINYSIVSDVHPTIRVCDSMNTLNWKAEDDPECLANVTWSGSSGAYVAYVQAKTAQDKLFVTATYEAGGESYIRNVAPVSISHLYIGDTKYAVGTATISGHTVLTLTPAP